MQTHVFTNFPHQDDSDSDDKAELLEEEKNKSQHSRLSFSYYQSFFDVDTKQVLGRIIGSFFPDPRMNYLKNHIRPKPDFYGPFWVSTTLIMSIAVAGNLINYFGSYGSEEFKWKFDFHKVTIATASIYTYWLLMPLLVYIFLRWRGNQEVCQLSELICVYGYSLSIYIPISILCLVPVYWLQWLFVMAGMAMSGIVLVFTMWTAIRGDRKQVAVILVALVVIMHCTLAVGFMLYFFSPPASKNSAPTTPTMVTPTSAVLDVTTTTRLTTSGKAFSTTASKLMSPMVS